MTESMPSSVQPAHAPQKPTICWRESLVRVVVETVGVRFSSYDADASLHLSYRTFANQLWIALGCEECCHLGLHDFTHCVTRKSFEHEEARRQLMGSDELSGPSAQRM